MNWNMRIAGNTIGGQAASQQALDQANQALGNFCAQLTKIEGLGLEIAHQTSDVGYSQVWPEAPAETPKAVQETPSDTTSDLQEAQPTTAGAPANPSARATTPESVGQRHP